MKQLVKNWRSVVQTMLSFVNKAVCYCQAKEARGWQTSGQVLCEGRVLWLSIDEKYTYIVQFCFDDLCEFSRNNGISRARTEIM